MNEPIAPETVRALLSVDYEAGKLFWRSRGVEWFSNTKRSAQHNANRWNSRHAGTEALTYVTADGYRRGSILGRLYRAHRVVFAHYHGRWPELFVDHKNGDVSDNSIGNLREASFKENCQNRRSQKGSTSKYLGVSWYPNRNKWVAKIRAEGRVAHIGYFNDEESAHAAYRAEAEKHFGSFAAHLSDPK